MGTCFRSVTEGMGNSSSLHETQEVVEGIAKELPDQYKVNTVVGFGSYGLVCSAEVDGNPVAVKKVSDLFLDGGDCKRILREIKLLKHLKHPNILTLTAILQGQTAATVDTYNQIYLITDLLETDLHTIIKSEQALSPCHVSYFTWQILKGLDYLHRSKVMHRDIKPANILVNKNCDLKICDFGLARGRNEGEQELTEYVVTRWYRAPELLLFSREYSGLVDIWSAGCVVAEMVEKKPLWPGVDYINQLTMIAQTMGPASLSWSKEAARFFSLHSEPLSLKPLASLVPSHPAHGAYFISFLSLLLLPNPLDRPTASELLPHPYLLQHHNEYEAAQHLSHQPLPFKWSVDTDTFATDFTEAELRGAIWKEIDH
eukprot:TRINITY_DN37331_c0_g1_i1.p1 TRINITY_DN37331_c0_g1~~TRINITY_DN37331_c0_g1_i1.p1  ORF type:complete len:372 (+),score=58.49 TRINITY_DN37331_c0_g1_i1:39-1154(+)